MNQSKNDNNKSVMGSPGLLIYWVAGCGFGSAAGWFLVPGEFHRIGLGVGAVIGGLIVHFWLRHQQKRDSQQEIPPSLGFVGRLIYLLFFSLSLIGFLYVANAWIDQPEKWLEALGGLLFTGTGMVVFLLLWKKDAAIGSGQIEVQTTKLLGWCAIVIAIVSLTLIPLGNPFLGVIGGLFSGYCGIYLIRKNPQA